tara:strand:+ start:16577 stop:17140 length:564 start_codon:yes stop_codon:yes gene_type:complete
MKIGCIACGEFVIDVIDSPYASYGRFTHCSITTKYVVEHGKAQSWEFSGDSYNPGHIYHSNISVQKKEAGLTRLLRILGELEYDYRNVYLVNHRKTKEYLTSIRKQMLNAVTADHIARPDKTFDTLKTNWNNKGVTLIWRQSLLIWARANGEKPFDYYEQTLKDLIACVRFARANGIEIPEHLQGIE